MRSPPRSPAPAARLGVEEVGLELEDLELEDLDEEDLEEEDRDEEDLDEEDLDEEDLELDEREELLCELELWPLGGIFSPPVLRKRDVPFFSFFRKNEKKGTSLFLKVPYLQYTIYWQLIPYIY